MTALETLLNEVIPFPVQASDVERLDELREILADNLPANLRAMIDRGLAAGHRPQDLFRVLRHFVTRTAKAITGPGSGKLTLAQIEAYLHRRAKGGAQ